MCTHRNPEECIEIRRRVRIIRRNWKELVEIQFITILHRKCVIGLLPKRLKGASCSPRQQSDHHTKRELRADGLVARGAENQNLSMPIALPTVKYVKPYTYQQILWNSCWKRLPGTVCISHGCQVQCAPG